MSKNALVKNEEKNQLPAEILDDLIADAGAGLEDMKASDITVPFLRIIQALSPQLDEREPEYIKGAKKGDLFLNTTKEVFKEAIIVPCFFTTQLIQWNLRENGGGLVAIHRDESILKNTYKGPKGEDLLKDDKGNVTEVVRTATYYCLMVNEESGETVPVVVSMQKTQFKKAKNWNALISTKKITNPKNGQILQKPMFSHAYKIGSIPEQNDKGKWDGFTIEDHASTHALKNGQTIYQVAKTICDLAKEGSIKTESLENEDGMQVVNDASNVM